MKFAFSRLTQRVSAQQRQAVFGAVHVRRIQLLFFNRGRKKEAFMAIPEETPLTMHHSV